MVQKFQQGNTRYLLQILYSHFAKANEMNPASRGKHLTALSVDEDEMSNAWLR